MARIDGILNIVVQQKATELRLGTGRVPKLLRQGDPLRFLMPETSEETLRGLLGDLLTEPREHELLAHDRLQFPYATEALGQFEVTFKLRRLRQASDPDGRPPTGEVEGFDVSFRREATPLAPEPTLLEPTGAPTAPSPLHASPPVGGLEAWAGEAPPALIHEAPRASDALRALLQRAVDLGASDLHLADDEVPVVRLDGRLSPLQDEARVIPEVVLAGCLTPTVLHRLHQGRSADLALEVAGLGRFRVNLYRSAGGVAAAMRILTRRAPQLGDLHLPVSLSDVADLPHGLILVCGPTGSGKSSTLAAIAQEVLQRRSVMLISLEDPTEFLLEPRRGQSLVRQRQIGMHVRDFATGLRDALREDPDVILIGEMRDPETIGLALTAAETGHLVLASLHSRSTVNAIERIVDSYAAERQQQVRVQLADALRVAVAQRLLPRATGQGRVPAVEVLRVTHNVRSLIREMRTAQIVTAIQAGRTEGMLPLERCLADMLRRGTITADAARRVANDDDTLDVYLRG